MVGLARAVFTGPRRLAIAYEHTPRVHVVDLGADGPPTPQRLFEAAHAPGLGSAVRALAAVWAPDGRCAGLLAGGDGQAVDWVDPATGRPLAPPWRVPATPSTRDPVTGAPTFATPDILALAAVTSGARTTVLVGGGWDHAWLLEVSPDGGWRQVGAGLGDLPTPFSDAAPAPQAGRFAYVCSLGGTAFSGERMEDAAGYFQVREVDARPGQPVAPAATAFDGAPRPRCVAYAPDGSLVVGRDGGAVLARVGGAIVEVFRADVMGERDVADLTFARDGRRLWVTATHGWKDGQPRDRTGASVFGLRWPPGEAGCEVLQRHDDLPLTLSLDVAPDGALVAVGCVDGSVQVFVVGAP